MRVAVVGAAGRIGVPFSLVLASAGHSVLGIDRDAQACRALNAGRLRFSEDGAQDMLNSALERKAIHFTDDLQQIADVDAVVIVVGTPVDCEGNPRLDDLVDFVATELAPRLTRQLVVIRSTVVPGTTENLRDITERLAPATEGLDFDLVYCPERVAQGHSISETKRLPQLVGAFSERGFARAEEFFATFMTSYCIRLSPREAEFGKIITNIYRYVHFALSNEFFVLGDRIGVDAHRVIEACNRDYERMAAPPPGPNVGGPCLYKDWRFVWSGLPHLGLTQVAAHVNEAMPGYILTRSLDFALRRGKHVQHVAILGMAFKANSDDTRYSLSFKLKKACVGHGLKVACVDDLVAPGSEAQVDWADIDLVVVMTPHARFRDLFATTISRSCSGDTIIADAWKFLEPSREFHSGIFSLSDVAAT